MIRTRTSRGFSLIEIVVSVGLFAIVMLIATSAYYTLISLDRRARATNQVVNNLWFAVDAMTRGIRTGTEFKCINGGPDANGNSTSGNCTQFYYKDTLLPAGANYVTYFRKADGTIGRCESSSSCLLDASASSITDPGITITNLTFVVRGAGSSNDIQPQVIFTIQGTMPANSAGEKTSFTIQETATQRRIDI
jgi:prepilin-type N-terminal cleavage/methylation domain-containing protein